MKKSIKIYIVILFFLLLFGYAEAGTRDKTPPPQLIITYAVADLTKQEITIKGFNFCVEPKPKVYMRIPDDQEVSELEVDDGNTAENIVANLPADVPPGTYLLVVECGSSATRIFAMDVTIGAVE